MDFTKDTARFLRDLKKVEVEKKESNKIEKAVKYVESVYAKKIEREIERNYTVREVNIRLPMKYKNINQDRLVERVREAFKSKGFSIRSYGGHCNCILNPICNRNYGLVFSF